MYILWSSWPLSDARSSTKIAHYPDPPVWFAVLGGGEVTPIPSFNLAFPWDESLSLSVCLHLEPVLLLPSPDCRGLGFSLHGSVLSLRSLSHHLCGPPLLILSHSNSDVSDLCCVRDQLHISFWTCFCQVCGYELNCLLCAEPHAGGFREGTKDGKDLDIAVVG